ncbi:hypothetical protein Dd1591_1803 [Dickeya chrysanthemi Ech1591]|uniref:Uncharacterized protein n=1 Tax=Dickeya chrysanthemi (strain Ech1591) TaxID=561229 RepID=C6CG84_DICC1|nr:hypothetical protein Dd1591_1803 [Dickeya chrysanthemi Ech1591]
MRDGTIAMENKQISPYFPRLGGRKESGVLPIKNKRHPLRNVMLYNTAVLLRVF